MISTVFLDKITNWMERCQVSFDGIAMATRANRRELDGRYGRLDRQTLTYAWFVRDTLAACVQAGLCWPTPRELRLKHRATVRRVWTEYRVYFKAQNLRNHDHRCVRPGRCRTAAMDGIHNLTTFKCKTQTRFYKLLQGWGQLPMGCVNPPAPGSAYCGECLQLGGLRTPQEGDPEFVDPAKAAAKAEARKQARKLGPEATSLSLSEMEEAHLRPAGATNGDDDPAHAAAPAAPSGGVQGQAERVVRRTTAAQRDAFAALSVASIPLPPPGVEDAEDLPTEEELSDINGEKPSHEPDPTPNPNLATTHSILP